MSERARRVKVGAFLLVSIAVVIAAVFVLGKRQTLFMHKALLRTWFKNTSGLTVGAPVRLAGVEIGGVQTIEFSPDLREKKVYVVLSVDARYLDRIRADSVARLSSKGLLGDAVVDVSVGGAEAVPLASGATLASAESEGLNEVIAAVQDAAQGVRALSSTVDERLRVVLSDDLARDVSRIARSTANVVEGVEHGGGLAHALVYDRRLVRGAEGVLADARRAAVSADRAIGRADELLGAVEHGSGTLHALLYRDDATRILGETQRAASELADVVGEVKHGHGLLHSLVYEKERSNLLENLTALSRTLREVGDDVRDGKGTVGALLKDPSVYEDLKMMLGNVKRNRLLRALVRFTVVQDDLARPGPLRARP